MPAARTTQVNVIEIFFEISFDVLSQTAIPVYICAMDDARNQQGFIRVSREKQRTI